MVRQRLPSWDDVGEVVNPGLEGVAVFSDIILVDLGPEKRDVGQEELRKEERKEVHLSLEDFPLLWRWEEVEVEIEDFLQGDRPRKLLEGGVDRQILLFRQRTHVVAGREQVLYEADSLGAKEEPLQMKS